MVSRNDSRVEFGDFSEFKVNCTTQFPLGPIRSPCLMGCQHFLNFRTGQKPVLFVGWLSGPLPGVTERPLPYNLRIQQLKNGDNP